MIKMTQEINHYLALVEQLERQRADGEFAWLRSLRRQALRRFEALGFPTTHEEEWRFTNVAPIAEMPFAPARYDGGVTQESLAPFTFGGMAGTQLVFVNGRYVPELCSRSARAGGARSDSLTATLVEGFRIIPLATALEEEPEAMEAHLARYAAFDKQAFTALNTACWEDGAFLWIPKGKVIEEPIHLLFVSTARETPTVSHPRVLIHAGENSQARIIESYVGLNNGVYFTNAVTEVVLGENAVVDHYKLQRESREAFHVATMQIQLARSSNFSSHSIGLGGALARNDVNAVLGGEGIACTLNGLCLATGRQQMDNHTAIDHALPHCESHELYKHILDDRAHGVFNGKIFVRQDAQKTDAKQTNQTLLLSDDAQMNTKPQLEIFADDVKCTHGATVGQLDAEALFYLRTRGIAAADARALLTYAFVGDIIERIQIEPVRAALNELLLTQLPKNPP